jgi:hypothetical protein
VRLRTAENVHTISPGRESVFSSFILGIVKGDLLPTRETSDSGEVQQKSQSRPQLEAAASPNWACPVCGSVLIDIRHKLQC